jgi:hypothetical protein
VESVGLLTSSADRTRLTRGGTTVVPYSMFGYIYIGPLQRNSVVRACTPVRSTSGVRCNSGLCRFVAHGETGAALDSGGTDGPISAASILRSRIPPPESLTGTVNRFDYVHNRFPCCLCVVGARVRVECRNGCTR